MRKRISFTLLLAALGTAAPGRAQEVVNPNCNLSREISIDDLTKQATLVVEGRAGAARSFWNGSHSHIYTATTVTVYKVFKGSVQGGQVEIVTPGGTVGDEWQERVDDPAVLPLGPTTVGIFFGAPTQQGTQGATVPTAQVLDVIGKYEGLFRYSGQQPDPTAAFSPCRRYRNVPITLYEPIQAAVGRPYEVVSGFDINTYDRYALPAPVATARRTASSAPAAQKKFKHKRKSVDRHSRR